MINVAKEMEHLHKLAVENQATRFPRLWEKIISEEWLAQAWEEIRKNQGSQTPGIDRRTADDIDLERIRQTLKETTGRNVQTQICTPSVHPQEQWQAATTRYPDAVFIMHLLPRSVEDRTLSAGRALGEYASAAAPAPLG